MIMIKNKLNCQVNLNNYRIKMKMILGNLQK